MKRKERTTELDFLSIVSNFNLNINFHKEKFPPGKFWFNNKDHAWHNNPEEDFWGFDQVFGLLSLRLHCMIHNNKVCNANRNPHH